MTYHFDQVYEGPAVPALYDCLSDERYLRVARELAAAYRVIGPSERPWFSFVTEDQFLWFEEQPLDGAAPPMILNGHITALTGLYYLWDLGGREEDVLELLRSGLATTTTGQTWASTRTHIGRWAVRPADGYERMPP